MNVVLVNMANKLIDEDPGLACLCSYLNKNDIECGLLTYYHKNPDVGEIKSANPKLVGFSMYEFNWASICDLAGHLKRVIKDVKIVLGGYMATYQYLELMESCKEIDFVILGPGERSLKSLYACLAHQRPYSSLAAIAYREQDNIYLNPLMEETDSLEIWPVLDRTTLKQQQSVCAKILFTRQIKDRNRKTITNKRFCGDVINEMISLVQNYNVSIFDIMDNGWKTDREFYLHCFKIMKDKGYTCCYMLNISDDFSHLEPDSLSDLSNLGLISVHMDMGEVLYQNLDDVKTFFHRCQSFDLSYSVTMASFDREIKYTQIPEILSFLNEHSLCFEEYFLTYPYVLKTGNDEETVYCNHDISHEETAYLFAAPEFTDEKVARLYMYLCRAYKKLHEVTVDDAIYQCLVDFRNMAQYYKRSFREPRLRELVSQWSGLIESFLKKWSEQRFRLFMKAYEYLGHSSDYTGIEKIYDEINDFVVIEEDFKQIQRAKNRIIKFAVIYHEKGF